MRGSIPIIPVEVPELDSLGKVLGGDTRRGIQIGDGACDAQQTVVGAGREIHAANRHLERALAGVVQSAKCA